MTRWVDDLATLDSAAPLDGSELIRLSDGGVSKRATIANVQTFLSSSFLTSANIGTTVQGWDGDLDAVAALSATGFATRIASNSWTTRTIGGTTNEIAIANGDGVAGAPVISLASALVFTGKTITGGTFASPTAITGLPDPSSAQDAATKAYVDSVAAGLDVKPSVKCATTANITLSGEQTIDGITTASSRVLVKNQSTASQNGVYISASGAWTRAADMDAWTKMPGSFVFVEEGSTNADTAWVCTADASGTLGTTSITWSQFAGAGTYSASGGLSLAGTQFSIANSGVTYAKIQNVSATQRVLGRITAGAGVTEEVTASQVLDWIGSTQGQVLYRSASGWTALGVGTSGQFLKTNGAGADPAWATPSGAGDVTAAANFGTDNRAIRSDGVGKGVQASGITIDDSDNVSGVRSIDLPTIPNVGFGTLINLGLSATVATNAMTIALKGADGNDPSSTNKVYIPFPNFAATTARPTWIAVSGALSVVIPASTTIGTANNVQSPIYIYAINNAGAAEMAVSLKYHGEAGTISTTAISGGATSTTMYSTTARTSVGYRILGVAYSTQTTAGTWAASPSAVQIAPLKLKGYGFRADRSTNQTGWLTATLTKVQLNSESFDDDSTFDSATNYRFTCEEPGTYFFNGSGDSNAGNSCTFYIYKNGAINLTLATKAASTAGTSQGSGPIALVPGDYVELYGYQASGSTDAIYGVAGYTWLAGRMTR